jgi:hypothetical protein
MDYHAEPTYANQLWQARKIAATQGPEELRRHALVGQMCRCGNCFCCAALFVYSELKRASKTAPRSRPSGTVVG